MIAKMSSPLRHDITFTLISLGDVDVDVVDVVVDDFEKVKVKDTSIHRIDISLSSFSFSGDTFEYSQPRC